MILAIRNHFQFKLTIKTFPFIVYYIEENKNENNLNRITDSLSAANVACYINKNEQLVEK